MSSPPPLRSEGAPEGSFSEAVWTGDAFADWLDGEGLHDQADKHRKDAADLYRTPHPVKTGPIEFSVSGVVSRWPLVVWDVNAYYSTLGVSPHSSRKEIREAYQRLEGWRSERLTYIVSQLFDPAVRSSYDACKPGSVFFDRYTAALVKERMLQEHRREHGRSLDPEESTEEKLDLSRYINSEFDLDNPTPTEYVARWKWGFYLWKSGEYDIPKLSEWMRCVCIAFAGQSRHLAVGLMGGDRPASLVKVGYITVAFINANTNPTVKLAQSLEN